MLTTNRQPVVPCLVLLALVIVFALGCGLIGGGEADALKNELAQKEQEIARLERQLASSAGGGAELQQCKEMAAGLRSRVEELQKQIIACEGETGAEAGPTTP